MILYYSIVYVLLQVFGEQKRHTFLIETSQSKCNSSICGCVKSEKDYVVQFSLRNGGSDNEKQTHDARRPNRNPGVPYQRNDL